MRILEYQPRMLHMEIALCDEWRSIGSSNLDRFGRHAPAPPVDDRGCPACVDFTYDSPTCRQRSLR